jgi:hypothetical protein
LAVAEAVGEVAEEVEAEALAEADVVVEVAEEVEAEALAEAVEASEANIRSTEG